MQAKLSAGNYFLRFSLVTGGNLPAPADILREFFIVRVKADFFKPWNVSLYPVPNTLTKVSSCCFQSVIQKEIQHAEKFLTTIKKFKNWPLTLFYLSHIYRVKEKCQADV